MKSSNIELNFIRIKNGERISIENIPFKIDYYDFLIKYYEETEEFEKCRIILSQKDIILNHDSNYHITEILKL